MLNEYCTNVTWTPGEILTKLCLEFLYMSRECFALFANASFWHLRLAHEGSPPVTRLSHISRTFWLTGTKLRKIPKEFETAGWRCETTGQRGLVIHERKYKNLHERFDTFCIYIYIYIANAVRNLSPTVAAQWERGLTSRELSSPVRN